MGHASFVTIVTKYEKDNNKKYRLKYINKIFAITIPKILIAVS